MSNPYEALPPSAFWRPAVGSRDPLAIDALWSPKISLTKSDRVITAGSCFAQHIGRALAANGFNWFDAERGPGPAELDRQFGYGIFSFRTGNIYTAALLRQWVGWALGEVAESDEAWEADGRVFDPFRPAIEPGGFASVDEMRAARAVTLAAIRRAVTKARLFVFTLGLTEGWANAETGVAYPMCPGTLAGTFDADRHRFRNYRAAEIAGDLRRVFETIRAINPALQVLLTVSPVPLTATASGRHVLVATTYSKSVLRTVAGELAEDMAFVDYFPSYEIITAPVFGGRFYQPNQREVRPEGVAHVMTHVFAGLGIDTQAAAAAPPPPAPGAAERAAASEGDDVECEEALLDAFEGVR